MIKDITMDNQQETKRLIIILVGSSETVRQNLIRCKLVVVQLLQLIE